MLSILQARTIRRSGGFCRTDFIASQAFRLASGRRSALLDDASADGGEFVFTAAVRICNVLPDGPAFTGGEWGGATTWFGGGGKAGVGNWIAFFRLFVIAVTVDSRVDIPLWISSWTKWRIPTVVTFEKWLQIDQIFSRYRCHIFCPSVDWSTSWMENYTVPDQRSYSKPLPEERTGSESGKS